MYNMCTTKHVIDGIMQPEYLSRKNFFLFFITTSREQTNYKLCELISGLSEDNVVREQ